MDQAMYKAWGKHETQDQVRHVKHHTFETQEYIRHKST